jgi:phosphoadenosine phosphosulfate reductase
MNNEQMRLPAVDNYFLGQRIEESRRVIREVAKISNKPLVVQFSGGRDSMALLDMVRQETHFFVAAYMATGTELPGVITFVRDYCKREKIKLLVSNPGMHKGHIIQRIKRFERFPLIENTWCCRDLKLRPQKKMLVKQFGKGVYFKLEGVRRFESTRRKFLYAAYANNPIRPDGEFYGSFEVFPILNWADVDVTNYIEGKHLTTMSQYKDFGVSGCSWCPFYGPKIYYKVLQWNPNWNVYTRIIQMEEKFKMPSVLGEVYLRDIRQAVLDGRPCPEASSEGKEKGPCTILYEGKRVPTCSVYGHLFISGKCLRCEQPEPEAVNA